ncbi:Putative porin [Zhouia amylolytica]|uniref:Putative porin n=1 Tax=Zhouia amylolytica TaxID=376730 RepID=A0A1I6VQS5_9FLAO|nr:putative porin [Zhouia amylolytica]SFT16037.1 Putative porin [Zhouia amylolytica]
MKKVIVFIVLVLSFTVGVAQVQPQRNTDRTPRAAQNRKLPADQAKNQADQIVIQDYKIITLDRDTTFLDTTLSVKKEYKYNYLRKDNFELLPFSNLGQTYNSLALASPSDNFYPGLGARAKHFNYMEVEDINYYHVPTPMTDLFFKTTMEQGQLLDAFITLNTSRQFNMAIAYKGLRSLGKYQHILASTGNFRFITSYASKDKRYNLRMHFISQDILNEENGGIANRDQFESGNPEFVDRSRMDVNFENAENFLLGKRYFLDQEYVIVENKENNPDHSFTLGHRLNYETKYYEFRQDSQDSYFGEAFQSSGLNDRARLKSFSNQIRLDYKSRLLGNITVSNSVYAYNYYFNSIVVTQDQTIPNQMKGEDYSYGAEWTKKIGGFYLNAEVGASVYGDLGGNLFKGSAGYVFDNENEIAATIKSVSASPDFNFLLYQSDYKDYNWDNRSNFNTEKNKSLSVDFKTKRFGTLNASYSVIDDYTYFYQQPATVDETFQVKPLQYQNTINYLKVKYTKDLKFGKFGLYNTVMYQEVAQDDEVLNVPQLVTRNTFYFSDHVFKKAMFLQTGITFKYFTEYKANAYSPLLGEFYVQDQEQIGNFPMLDFFINAKVRQTRIYLKAEHFNSSFSGYNFYSAPDYPYRDFIIRFGLVWNFFS